ncbi:transthyretin [Halichoeres trimaculatus]|uniref:transthyretin n=1 Tax=Halichoeres trimaculatus TaxID=147232 RepID=UPI003D9F5428
MLQTLHCLLLASAVLLCHSAPAPTERHGSSDTKCPLTVKILDAVKGTPAGSLALKVSQKTADGGWTHMASGETDNVGEAHNLITEQQFQPGVYRVEFDTKSYWKSQGSVPLHEVAEVVFEAHIEGHRHYTLALLISPASFTNALVMSEADLHQSQ